MIEDKRSNSSMYHMRMQYWASSSIVRNLTNDNLPYATPVSNTAKASPVEDNSNYQSLRLKYFPFAQNGINAKSTYQDNSAIYHQKRVQQLKSRSLPKTPANGVFIPGGGGTALGSMNVPSIGSDTFDFESLRLSYVAPVRSDVAGVNGYQSNSAIYHQQRIQYATERVVPNTPLTGVFIPGGGGTVFGSSNAPTIGVQDPGMVVTKPIVRKQLALLLPGHNEELIIATTIKSAVAAGQDISDIYVVDDDSDDNTREIAVKLLGVDNVLTVPRSGKALAVSQAIDQFDIVERYTWLHVADADSVFCPDYFRIYKKKLNPEKYAVAVGFVQSLRGNWISNYRSLTYTYSQHVGRRIQAYLGMISVFPGPITCFRTDILSEIDFSADSLTEDFDITLQVHRKKLGGIVYIPKAINYTQDPQTLSDFTKQNLRWQRGFFQGVKKYKIGLHGQRIDASLGFQMSQTVLFMIQLLILYPLILSVTQNWLMIPVAIAIDFILNAAIALWASIITKRWSLFGALPYFYFLRWAEVGIYLTAFVEVMVLGRFKTSIRGWSTKGRRYALNSNALSDIAA